MARVISDELNMSWIPHSNYGRSLVEDNCLTELARVIELTEASYSMFFSWHFPVL